VISDADLRHVGADCRHDPGDLVTKHRWCWNEIVSGKEQVSVTQPGRLYIYENFVANGHREVHILKVKPATDRVKHKRLHVATSLRLLRTVEHSKAAGKAMGWRSTGSGSVCFSESVAAYVGCGGRLRSSNEFELRTTHTSKISLLPDQSQ
jgi:hypothetical protein